MVWIVLASIIGGILLLDLIVRLFFARIILREFEKKLATTKTSSGPPNEETEPIEFTTADGIKLRGSLHGGGHRRPRGLVVFCPELNGDHFSAAEYCRGLLDAGFVVLAFDFRNQGESESAPDYEPLHWVTDHEMRDVRAALAYIQTRSDLRDLPVGIMGISRGGGVALAAAAGNPSIKAVAVEGAFSTRSMQLNYSIRYATVYAPAWFLKLIPGWHVKSTLFACRWLSELRRNCRYTNLERLLPKLSDRPVLMIAGCNDTYVPLDVPKWLQSQINGSECELWQVRSAKHNGARRVNEAVYDRRIRDFFAENLSAMSTDYDADNDSTETDTIGVEETAGEKVTAGS